MSFRFEPTWPWPFVVLLAAVMLAVVSVGYPRRVRHLPLTWQRLLLVIRVLIVVLLCVWLLRPVAVLESDSRSNAAVYVLLDNSRSMNTADAPGGATRKEALIELFETAKPLLAEIGETVDIRIREFAEDLQTIEAPGIEAKGRFTAIGSHIEKLAGETTGTDDRIAMILLWGDGRQAVPASLNTSPMRAAKLAGKQHCPIYTVGYGSSDVVSNTLDVALSDLDVARDVFQNNAVPLKVRLRTAGALNRDVRLKVLVERRSGLPNGQSGPMEAIPADDDGNQTVRIYQPDEKVTDAVVDLQFVPQDVGEVKIAVVAEPLNDEVRITNNRVEAIVRVRSGGIRVAYFDQLRPEFKWLRQINFSNRVQLDSKWVTNLGVADDDSLSDWFVPGRYDAFIIGDVPADAFSPEQLKNLRLCCSQGAGLMMIGGQQNFGPGGYHKTPLAALLPVEMRTSDQHLTGEVEMIPSATSINNPILQIAPPEQNTVRWNDLPALQGANALRLKQGTAAQVLAESAAGMPVLVGQSTGAGRILAFAGDTTWQWALYEDWAVEAHQRFWRQTIFWLTRTDDDSENPLWVKIQPRNVIPGGEANITFGLRDGDGVPLANVEYEVAVQTPEGDKRPLSARAVETYAAADFQETDFAGDYWASVSAKKSASETLYASRRFLVNARDVELDNPAADPALMRELAHVSGGDYLTPEEMVERLTTWARDGLPSLELTTSRRVSLWDNWVSLLVFVILLTVEWYLRKRRGLV